MAWVRVRRPPLLQSKLLCLSLLYLLTTLPLALYVSFSDPSRCLPLHLLLLRPARPSPPATPLFEYPRDYGVHKYSLPTPRALCSDPAVFSGLGLHRPKRSSPLSIESDHSHHNSQGLCFLSQYFPSNCRSCEWFCLFIFLSIAICQKRRSFHCLSDPQISFFEQIITPFCKRSMASAATSRRDIVHSLRCYQNGRRDSFAGNFSTEERRSFFNHTDSAVEIPCGFFKDFPLAQADRLAMESCRGVVVASAIFNDHDKIRQPKGLGSHTVKAACFFMFIDDRTHRVLASHGILEDGHVASASAVVGAWRVVTLQQQQLPYEDPAMNGVVVKHLLHRLFPNARFSVWVDAKMQLTVDPLLLVHSLLAGKGADMAVSRHPFNLHAMEEAIATARWRKWRDVDAIRAQMEAYCSHGLQPWSPSKLPYPSDVPDTAIIIRRHGSASDLFSCLLFNELEAFNPRDQLAFAYVRDQMSPRVSINMFEVEVLEHISVEYRHNLKRDNGGGGGGAKQGIARMASSRDIAGSSCEGYLMKMWGEPSE
nr:LOW QUALITY PROTEIN: probable hexosyltransferase MUCI70 [Aegilops tauschii subsp. strangulata]